MVPQFSLLLKSRLTVFQTKQDSKEAIFDSF